jgi:hypothetical protein
VVRELREWNFIGALKGHAKGAWLKPLSLLALFHGLKAMASTVASLCEALCAASEGEGDDRSGDHGGNSYSRFGVDFEKARG